MWAVYMRWANPSISISDILNYWLGLPHSYCTSMSCRTLTDGRRWSIHLVHDVTFLSCMPMSPGGYSMMYVFHVCSRNTAVSRHYQPQGNSPYTAQLLFNNWRIIIPASTQILQIDMLHSVFRPHCPALSRSERRPLGDGCSDAIFVFYCICPSKAT